MPAVSTLKREEVAAKFALDDSSLQGLTPKMYRFVTTRFGGASLIDAYKVAYDTAGMAPDTIAKRAVELSQHPLVTAKLRALRIEVDEQSTLSAALSRNFVLNGLMRLAQTAEKESVQLGALQTLGKTVGIDLFRETVVHETRSRTVEDVENELKQKLDTLRAGLTIEGKASSVPTPKDRRRKPAGK